MAEYISADGTIHSNLERIESGATSTVYALSENGRRFVVKAFENDLKELAESESKKMLHLDSLQDKPYSRAWPGYYDRGSVTDGKWSGPAFRMDFIGGKPLSKMFDELAGGGGRLISPKVTLEIARSVLLVLSALEEAKVQHGDLHPGNIMLLDEGAAGARTVGLIDFGLARLAGILSRKTRVRNFGPSLYISAPEIVGGKHHGEKWTGEYNVEDSPAADVFALGCILCRMATGTYPGQLECSEYAEGKITLEELLESKNSCAEKVSWDVAEGPDDDYLAQLRSLVSGDKRHHGMLYHNPRCRISAREAYEQASSPLRSTGEVRTQIHIPASAPTAGAPTVRENALMACITREGTLLIRRGIPNRQKIAEGPWEIDPGRSFSTDDDWPWHEARNRVLSVSVETTGFAPPTTARMFSNCPNCERAEISKIDMSRCESAVEMFCGCSSLREISWQGVPRSCTSTAGMFAGCRSLEKVDLAGCDFSGCLDASRMFYACDSLLNVSLSHLDFSACLDARGMFSTCANLMFVDLSQARFTGCSDISDMFHGCSSLSQADLSHADFSTCKSAARMFSGCSSLLEVDLAGTDMSACTDMSAMFSGCRAIDRIDLEGMRALSCRDLSFMFSGCSELTVLDLIGFSTTSARLDGVFSGCSSLKLLWTTGWDTRLRLLAEEGSPHVSVVSP